MTIPERMVALQEMMQSLIDAIYGEYRWTANVSHVSSTNVFTAINIINFDDSDFIVGQTVLFTDGYLGVVIEVDNSVNPKQFTAGHYMQLKGDKGNNGLDALTYKGVYVATSVPSTVISFPTMASNFNRTPVVGDVFNIVFRGVGSVLNRSWIGTYKVISLGTGVANCSGSIVETTGQQGEAGQGLVKRYMHFINFYSDDDSPQVKFVVYSNSAVPFTNISPMTSFLMNGGFNAANKSYPASGRVSLSGNVWGVYSNSPNVLYAQYGSMQNGISIHHMPFTDNVIDLGS